jgi:mRNA-degrading endonuclease YafQ of YafQ-DinJ toxin-antitoxin module
VVLHAAIGVKLYSAIQEEEIAVDVQVISTETFQQTFSYLSPQMQKITMRKIRLLAQHPHHPSLQPHRVQQCKEDLWIGYISMSVRLLYQYERNTLYLHEVGSHVIVDRVHLRSFNVNHKARRMEL